MFKRYKSPYDTEASSTTYEGEKQQGSTPPRRITPFNEDAQRPRPSVNEAPPRIYDGINQQHSSSHQTRSSEFERRATATVEDDSKRDNGNWMESQLKEPSNKSLSVNNEEPEATIGETVCFNGRLTFQRYLKIDGRFEGELSSSGGRLVVGPKGVVKSNLSLREAVIEGQVEGNITVSERIEIRGFARVVGNIEAKAISVDEGAVIHGQVKVVHGDGRVSAEEELERELLNT